MIGATSSLTYNVVGHIKTVLILSGGVVFFGDSMPTKELGGILVAMLGIVWWVLSLVDVALDEAWSHDFTDWLSVWVVLATCLSWVGPLLDGKHADWELA